MSIPKIKRSQSEPAIHRTDSFDSDFKYMCASPKTPINSQFTNFVFTGGMYWVILPITCLSFSQSRLCPEVICRDCSCVKQPSKPQCLELGVWKVCEWFKVTICLLSVVLWLAVLRHDLKFKGWLLWHTMYVCTGVSLEPDCWLQVKRTLHLSLTSQVIDLKNMNIK